MFKKKRVIFALAFICSLVAFTIPVSAENVLEINSLTDLFKSTAFRGSGETLSKFGFFATGMNFIITVFSLIGLSLTLYQKFITLLYLSSKPLWDTVNELKGGGSGGGQGNPWTGLIAPLTTGSNKGGTGIDAIIHFLYGLLPDIKSYCDYSSDALAKQNGSGGENGNKGKLQESDGVAQYIMKTALPTIILIFFLTIGFSGTLGKSYGVIVDSLAVFADTAVESNLAGYAQNLVGRAGGYDWTIPLSHPAGQMTQKVANEIFKRALLYMQGATPEGQQVVGRVIEDAIVKGNAEWLSIKTTDSSYSYLCSFTGTEDTGAFYNLIYDNASQVTKDEITALFSNYGLTEPNLSADMMENNIAPIQSVVNRSASLSGVSGITVDLKKLASAVGYSGTDTPEAYLHMYFNWKDSTKTSGRIQGEVDNRFDPQAE